MAYKRSALMEERLAGNRQRILLAARRLVAAGGFRGAPVTAVAAEAGVSTGLIYRHFPSKAELFVEVLTAAVDHELAILRGIAAEPAPAAQRLRAAIASFVRRALAGPGLAYAFIAEPVEPEVDAERIRCRRLFGDLFKGILADGVAAGEFPAQDLDAAAACLVGAYTEALVGPTAPSRDGPRDSHRLVEAVCGFCLRAVGSAQTG
ncbi:AcrR family transcriptional regulator [Xanthomonas translucens pv. arrhenatheri]|jgi:AcrR family transcriptional regulator|uniref:AcrR family transcriptional regulator n=4 Tax=Xanthomonas graminis TaxID=3390026 RepID=A0A199P541_9XANT|nr:TetR/AcrR family transcriptional regulator [Xanthomonas translucens]EKU26624.1 transcriptional regulator, TetR family [Xanthomonas translucens pv. graminis ART-Xtg29]OAX56125.1 AcrR family transcriptional regulator [Xanthomonas translucens pv. poae]OAX58311.1 AcrR family transcriptional regulator [Xanthomonas translucens pv. graminis]OAX66103.1 AcrR family transcriptional regulator [Xanthomonas translucens pv. arrhenatheri]UKE54629.1 TetR/AcrR family transcriptional regulator [Xanthomonas t